MNRHQIIIPENLEGRELLEFPYSDEAADDGMNSNSELSRHQNELNTYYSRPLKI